MLYSNLWTEPRQKYLPSCRHVQTNSFKQKCAVIFSLFILILEAIGMPPKEKDKSNFFSVSWHLADLQCAQVDGVQRERLGHGLVVSVWAALPMADQLPAQSWPVLSEHMENMDREKRQTGKGKKKAKSNPNKGEKSRPYLTEIACYQVGLL